MVTMRISKRQRFFRKLLCGTVAYFQVVGNTFQAFAQSSPGLSYGQVPTAAQWNSYFAGKVDYPFVLGPGIQQNVPNIQTSNYSIQQSDCGKVVVAGTGSTGFFNVTLPSVAGIQPNCVVTVKNGDTINPARAKGLIGFPADVPPFLYSGQSASFGVINGAWTTLANPGRWRVPFQPIFYVDNVLGNDSNDGLAPGTGGAFLTMAPFNTTVTQYIDTNNQIVSALFTNNGTATPYTNIGLNAIITGGGTLNLIGNGSTANSNTTSQGAIGIFVSPSNGTFANVSTVVQGFNVTCGGTAAFGLEIAQGFAEMFIGMNFGSCPAGNQIVVDANYARLILGANYTISGGASTHLTAIAGLIDFNSSAFTGTLQGTFSYTGSFALSEIGGNLISFNTWSLGASNVTGPRYNVNTGANIFTNGGGANFFPGNTPGAVSTGGRYDSPGTPTITGAQCGGSGVGSPTGTDFSGSVVVGQSTTSCTIQFTTRSTPKACHLQSSNATMQAGLVLSALSGTSFTASYPSPGASNPTLYWDCPAPS